MDVREKHNRNRDVWKRRKGRKNEGTKGGKEGKRNRGMKEEVAKGIRIDRGKKRKEQEKGIDKKGRMDR